MRCFCRSVTEAPEALPAEVRGHRPIAVGRAGAFWVVCFLFAFVGFDTMEHVQNMRLKSTEKSASSASSSSASSSHQCAGCSQLIKDRYLLQVFNPTFFSFELMLIMFGYISLLNVIALKRLHWGWGAGFGVARQRWSVWMMGGREV